MMNVLKVRNAYMERMSAYVALFAAIVQTRPFSGIQNPFGIANGWRWLASILNMSPRNITPFLLCSFLEVP